MSTLWNTKVSFVSVSQFGGLALCSPFWSVSAPFVTPHVIVSLEGRKKKGGKREDPKRKRKIKISFLVILNLFSEFCWSS